MPTGKATAAAVKKGKGYLGTLGATFGIATVGGSLIGGVKGLTPTDENRHWDSGARFLEGAAKGALAGGAVGAFAINPNVNRGIRSGVQAASRTTMPTQAEVIQGFTNLQSSAAQMAKGPMTSRKAVDMFNAGTEAVGYGIGAAATGGYSLVKGSVGGLKDMHGKMKTPDPGVTKEALKTSRPNSPFNVGVGLVAAGTVGGGLTYAALTASSSYSGDGHPGNLISPNRKPNRQAAQSQMEAMEAQKILMQNPMALGMRDLDEAYSYRGSRRSYVSPTHQADVRRRIRPGQYNDTGDLVFALHSLR